MSSLILSAGMPRSGSTWLYNALRLLLLERHPGPGQLACGWVGDLARLPPAPCRLVKLHEYDATLAAQASFVVWSFRDLRDAMASQFRKFGTPPTLGLADYLIAQDARWTARADHVMRYEDLLSDPAGEVQRLAQALDLHLGAAASETADSVGADASLGAPGAQASLSTARAQALVDTLARLSYDSDGPRNDTYNELTLLHRGHVTDGRAGSWPQGLPAALEREIAERHATWFAARGYDTGAPGAG